ncbi:MAG: dual specificity protein phosphatase family protein [Deltaproteobacteria bacterium]|nr:dual specificity protein phosphatase family protein [Deltaproteobacteria bacterium]
MIPRLFEWIETDARGGRLAIIPYPRGNEKLLEEIRYFKSRQVDVLVSLLTQAETTRLGLEAEAGWCETAGIRFLNHPILDHSVPPEDGAMDDFLEALTEELTHGRSLLIHCFAGIGRSGLTACALMVRAFGHSVEAACERVSEARGIDVPETAAQHQWLSRYAERCAQR